MTNLARAVPEIALEPLRWWDIAAVTAVEQQLFPADSPWTAEMFWSELAAGHHYVVHRAANGAVLGYAGVAVSPDPLGDSSVQTIGVVPAMQGRGIGRALLNNLLQHNGYQSTVLEVRCDNHPAIALYESVGFQRLSVRRKYYQPSGADAFVMRRAGVTSAGGTA